LDLYDRYGPEPLFAILVVTLDCLQEVKTRNRDTVLEVVDVYFPPIVKAVVG
jgi:hypothetical protein